MGLRELCCDEEATHSGRPQTSAGQHGGGYALVNVLCAGLHSKNEGWAAQGDNGRDSVVDDENASCDTEVVGGVSGDVVDGLVAHLLVVDLKVVLLFVAALHKAAHLSLLAHKLLGDGIDLADGGRFVYHLAVDRVKGCATGDGCDPGLVEEVVVEVVVVVVVVVVIVVVMSLCGGDTEWRDGRGREVLDGRRGKYHILSQPKARAQIHQQLCQLP